LTFDETVRKATLEETVCADTLWTGRLGDSIMRAFRETGNDRFAQVTIEELVEKPRPATTMPLSDITASIRLTDKSFTTRTRTGSGDNYLSQLDISLLATFQDGNGRPLGEVPLVYSENVNIYTPQYGGSGQCATQQLDGAMNYAADYLAQQFVGYVSELTAKLQGYQTAGRQIPGAGPPVEGPTALTLRVTLLDENNNLILEGGEKVGVRLDVTNRGAAAVGPATVTLSGSPALIDAFSAALSSQAQLAGLQAGETTSAILWGRLPATLEGQRGELTVTVTPSGTTGSGPATQTLVATMASSRTAAAASPLSPPVRQAPAFPAGGHDQNRYAVIVGLSLYRSPWPGWRDGLSFNTNEVVSLFAHSLGVPEGHTLLLQDELAAQADIEESLTLWLPKRVTKDSLVFFYFAGQTVADPTNGEVFLIPYDATPSSSPFRLISIRFLQSRLQKLGARLAIATIDSPMTARAPSKNGKIKSVAPNWIADLDESSGLKARTVMQVSRIQGTSRLQNSLLAGLTGPADLDRDGLVTVGEWLRSLRGRAVTAPTLPPTLAIQSIPLTQVIHQPFP
jgi:hypothetical protein